MGKIIIWHVLSVYSVTVFTVITMMSTLLSAIVFPVKRRNGTADGAQQAGAAQPLSGGATRCPPQPGQCRAAGRMLDEKSPPSPSGTFLSHGR